MAEKYIIGVDNGSQSTKVYIFNPKGQVICMASQPLEPMMHRKPGYVEHPDDDIWDSIKTVLKKVMGMFEGDPKDIVGLGLCTIRCCRAFMKADGTLAAPIMSWMDVRSYATYEDDPEIRYTCAPSGYITHRFTGEFKDTAGNVFQWQFPIDMDTWQWSEDKEHFDSFQIPREKLLDLQMPGTILGHITPEAAAETGLPVGIPVVGTANDKAVEALGAGLVKDDLGLISLGTYSAPMVCGKDNRPDPVHYFTNLSCIPNRYLYEATGIRRGMWHISWYKSILGEEYAKKAKNLGISVEEMLEQEARKVPVGSDGLLTVPDWLAPANQLYRKGMMIGFDERHTRGHIYRSIMEGMAMTLKNYYDAMNQELGAHPNQVIISGGGSNSDLFMQIFADIFGVNTVRNEMNGSAAMGSAICVAVATSLYSSFDEAVASMVKVKDVFTPNAQNHALYNRINDKAYRDLPGMMENTLKTIYDAFNE